jgi:DNA polymerase III subunit delta
MVAVKPAEAERFLSRPQRDIVVYLVFGSDAGLVSERAKKIIARSIDDAKDPFQFLRLSGDDLAADPLRLGDEANTLPLFGGRRAIAIDAQGKSLVAALEPVLAVPPRECTIVIEAGNLKRDAPLRRLCERDAHAAALECTPDSAKDLGQLIDAEVRAEGLAIEPAAKDFLVSLLGQDRLTTRAEIGKLVLYARGTGMVTTDHVAAIVADASSLAVDAAITGAFEGDFAAIEATAERVFLEGGDYNLLLGAALRYATSLHRARLDAEAGRTGSDSGSTNFGFGAFRRGAAFDRHIRAWTSAKLARMISVLSQAIGKARREPRLADMIAVRALWSVALAAKKSAA